jgi:hypothetical protein
VNQVASQIAGISNLYNLIVRFETMYPEAFGPNPVGAVIAKIKVVLQAMFEYLLYSLEDGDDPAMKASAEKVLDAIGRLNVSGITTASKKFLRRRLKKNMKDRDA